MSKKNQAESSSSFFLGIFPPPDEESMFELHHTSKDPKDKDNVWFCKKVPKVQHPVMSPTDQIGGGVTGATLNCRNGFYCE